MVDLSIDFHKLKLKNPVLTASGTFGYGEEFEDFTQHGSSSQPDHEEGKQIERQHNVGEWNEAVPHRWTDWQ